MIIPHHDGVMMQHRVSKWSNITGSEMFFKVFFVLMVSFLLLQVGTLDVLVGLSDELAKLDSFVERYTALPPSF